MVQNFTISLEDKLANILSNLYLLVLKFKFMNYFNTLCNVLLLILPPRR